MNLKILLKQQQKTDSKNGRKEERATSIQNYFSHIIFHKHIKAPT